jgi:hypothetical protein
MNRYFDISTKRPLCETRALVEYAVSDRLTDGWVDGEHELVLGQFSGLCSESARGPVLDKTFRLEQTVDWAVGGLLWEMAGGL